MSASLDTIPTGQPGAPTTADPNAAVTPQVPEVPQAPPPDEFQYRLPTGSMYRTEQDLVNGAIEKDYTIERQRSEIERLKAAQYRQPAPQVPPPAQTNGLDARAAQIFEIMKAEFPDRDEADLRGFAKVQAKTAELQEARNRQAAQATQWEAEYVEVRRKDPSFDINAPGTLGYEIFDKYPNRSPREHYALYLLERSERGLGAAPTAPSTAAAGMYGRTVNNTGGNAPTSAAPTEANHPYVIECVEAAKAKNPDPAYLAQVRQTAIDALPFVIRNRR